jgi:NAD(P)-dependent dehydrogenase (short-subunit alcohol dehydrogenase family)
VREPADTAVVERASAELTELAETVEGVQIVNVDISVPRGMAMLADELRDQWGRVPILMNNAGTGEGGDVLADLERWNNVIEVNLMGVLHGIQAFVPSMIRNGHPAMIINTGSKQGITQPPGNTAYNVSKAGVKALTEGLAHTLRERTGRLVTAHLLIPGFTWTGMTAKGRGEKPAAAWSPEQVVDYMFTGLEAGDFYFVCPDNETTPMQDRRRIEWALGDIVDNRPALSRWHPDYVDAFAAHMRNTS